MVKLYKNKVQVRGGEWSTLSNTPLFREYDDIYSSEYTYW